MKQPFIIIILLMIMGLSHAQQSGISVTGGIATYDLQDLKLYQEELISRMPVELQGFSSFPAYSNFKIDLFKQTITGLKYGVMYGYSSTGTHANYTDYSGILNLDQVITAYQFGVSASYQLVNYKYLELLAYGDFLFSYVRNKVNMNMTTSYFRENNILILSALSPFAEAGLEGFYRFNKFSLGIEGGYLYDIGTKFKTGEESQLDASVSLQPSGTIRSEMSGFRAGIKIVLWFATDFLE